MDKLVIIFIENDYEEAETLPAEEARAFASGVRRGGSYYGAGSCAAYVWPDDEDEMRASEPSSEVNRALYKLSIVK